MRNKFFKNFVFASAILITLLPTFVLARSEGGSANSSEGGSKSPGIEIKIENPFKQDTIQGLIEVVIREIFIPIGGVLAVLMVMWAGFMYVTARGNETEIKKAHDALLWAVIGAGILLGAWAISEAIGKTISQLKG